MRLRTSVLRKVAALVTAGTLLMALFVVQVAAVNLGDIDFEIDGNTAAGDDTPAGEDWESVILGGAPDWDAGPATLIQDGSSAPKAVVDEENIFAKGGKFGNPAGWTIEPGNVPAQNDLTNVYVNAYSGTDSESGDSWIAMGMHRIKKQGTFDLDFEFNKVAWNGASGTLTRTPGDIVVGYELSGNPEDPVSDLEVIILYYKPSDATCASETFFTGTVYGAGFCEVFRGNAGALQDLGAGTMNAVAFDAPPWGAFKSNGSPLGSGEQVAPFFFAEAAINLSELGIDLGCPGFGSVHAKSRSSLEVTADLKDLAGPVSFSVSCYIDGYKFHDKNANGAWDKPAEPGLAGWTIQLYDSTGTTLKDSTTTDSSGYYRFSGLSDGTYVVKEVCPSSWYQSYPGTNPATTCGGGTHTFTVNTSNPTHSGNFGNYQNGTVSGMKFKDADNSGTNNTGDSGLGSWAIKIYEDTGSTAGVLDAGDSFVDTKTTASDGSYSASLAPGSYLLCEVAQENWTQTAPGNSYCAADPDGLGLADGGYAVTVSSGGSYTLKDFGNTPLSDFDVRFFDLTGSTDATISCVDGDENPIGSSPSSDAGSSETSVEASGVVIDTYTCTITITDP